MSDAAPRWRELLALWWRIGWLSFGGPAAQIALMHAEVVERRRWVDEPRFLAALGYCNALPGPEAMQLAIWLGWRSHGIAGGMAAGLLFLAPGVLVMLALAWAYMAFGRLPWVDAVLAGLSLAVIVLVAEALWRLGRRALRGPLALALAGLALVLFAGRIAPFPLLLVAAALLGALVGRWRPQWLGVGAAPAQEAPAVATPSARAGTSAAVVLLLAWPLPLLLAAAFAGWDSRIVQLGLVMGQTAWVTFGGAYAVLPYVADVVVDARGWLAAAQMVDGLALAETTPGPLVLVLQFVGFVAGWSAPGGLSPPLAGVLAAALTVWMTFVPSFALVFAGAAFVERITAMPLLRAALAALNAVVFAAIAQLGAWYAWTVLADGGGVRWPLLAALAVLAAWRAWAAPSAGVFVVGAVVVGGLLAMVV
jgi:chromate transporter